MENISLKTGEIVDITIDEHVQFGMFVTIDGINQKGLVHHGNIRDKRPYGSQYWPLEGTKLKAVVLGKRDDVVYLSLKANDFTLLNQYRESISRIKIGDELRGVIELKQKRDYNNDPQIVIFPFETIIPIYISGYISINSLTEQQLATMKEKEIGVKDTVYVKVIGFNEERLALDLELLL